MHILAVRSTHSDGAEVVLGAVAAVARALQALHTNQFLRTLEIRNNQSARFVGPSQSLSAVRHALFLSTRCNLTLANSPDRNVSTAIPCLRTSSACAERALRPRDTRRACTRRARRAHARVKRACGVCAACARAPVSFAAGRHGRGGPGGGDACQPRALDSRPARQRHQRRRPRRPYPRTPQVSRQPVSRPLRRWLHASAAHLLGDEGHGECSLKGDAKCSPHPAKRWRGYNRGA
eukprot:6176163-Pleurochrysis_carterae.AAC.3